MRSEDLLRSIGNVDDKYIDELRNDKVVSIMSRRRHWLSVAACLAVLIFCAAVLMGIGMNVENMHMSMSGSVPAVDMAQNSVVIVDVNPSIGFEVNDRGIVVSFEALNADAEGIAGELSIIGLPYEDAVRQIIAVLEEDEFITDLKNSVLVSVENMDESVAEALRYAIVTAISGFGEETECPLSVLSQVITDVSEYAQQAVDYAISVGRTALIDKTCSAHDIFDFDQLAENTIQTINQLFEYVELPENLFRFGSAAGTVDVKNYEELCIEELSGEELISFTCAVSDFYDKMGQYYDLSAVSTEADYIVDIVCGRNETGELLCTIVAECMSGEEKDFSAIFSTGEKAISEWVASGELWRLIQKLG